MSESTRHSLEVAERLLDQATAELDVAKSAFVEQVARQVETSFDHVTRDLAKAHPKVSVGLTKDSAKALMDEAREILQQAAGRLRTAGDEVKWPRKGVRAFTGDDADAAVAGVIEPYLEELAARFEQRGFPNRRRQWGVPGQDLFAVGDRLTPGILVDSARRVQVASTAYFEAETRIADARKAHEDSEIDDLFD